MPEVRVTVEMDEAAGAAPREGDTDPDEHAAVTADHDRCVAGVEDRAHPIGKSVRVFDERGLVANATRRARRVVVDVAAGDDRPGFARAGRP